MRAGRLVGNVRVAAGTTRRLRIRLDARSARSLRAVRLVGTDSGGTNRMLRLTVRRGR